MEKDIGEKIIQVRRMEGWNIKLGIVDGGLMILTAVMDKPWLVALAAVGMCVCSFGVIRLHKIEDDLRWGGKRQK